MRHVEQRLVDFFNANEILDVFVEVTHREIAVVTVIPLHRDIDIVRFEGLEVRVTTVTITAVDSQQLVNRLTTLNISVIRPRHRLTEREPRHDVVGHAQTEINVGQDIVVATLQLREVSVTLNGAELVTAYPVDAHIVGGQRLRVHIGLLITHTQPYAKIHAAYFGGHVDLSVRC